MSVNGQLQDIQRTLIAQGVKLDDIKEDLEKTRENTGKLFEKSAEGRERLASLEARANGFERQAAFRGTVSGGLIGGSIIGIRMAWEWFAGK